MQAVVTAGGKATGLRPLGVIAVVAIVMSSCVTGSSPPSSSATASPVQTSTSVASPAVTPSRSPSPSPPATPRPGVLTTRGADMRVMRAETETTPTRMVPSGFFSPDGSRLAYWTQSAGAAQLHVLEIGSADHVLASFDGKRGGGVAWSTDGSGLLVSLADPDPQFFITRTLVSVDIASGATRQIYALPPPIGPSIIPLVWRRAPELFAAYETGPGGFSFGYTVIRPGQPAVRTDPVGQAIGFAASGDGGLVSGLWLEEGVVRVWPTEDFAKQTVLKPVGGETIAQPRWWPGRNEIAVAVARKTDAGFRDVRLERWDPASDTRTTVKRLPDGGALGAYFIRVDGTGVLTQGPYPPGAWEVTDLRTGASTPVPVVEGEIILGTITLR